MKRHIELLIVFLAVLAPQFLLASEVDGDEYGKATSGVAMAGVVIAAYRSWQGKQNKEQVEGI